MWFGSDPAGGGSGFSYSNMLRRVLSCRVNNMLRANCRVLSCDQHVTKKVSCRVNNMSRENRRVLSCDQHVTKKVSCRVVSCQQHVSQRWSCRVLSINTLLRRNCHIVGSRVGDTDEWAKARIFFHNLGLQLRSVLSPRSLPPRNKM